MITWSFLSVSLQLKARDKRFVSELCLVGESEGLKHDHLCARKGRGSVPGFIDCKVFILKIVSRCERLTLK